MNHRVGVDRHVQPAKVAHVLAVDEDVDMPAQRTGLVPDPGSELCSGDDGRIQDHPQRRCLISERHDELAGTISKLAQHSGQDDPHPVAHGSTTARTHSTSGSCPTIRAKVSPSSAEAYTSPLRVPK